VIAAPDQATTLRIMREAGDRAADLIATVDNVDRPVPGLTWSVGDTATHLLIELRGNREAISGQESSLTRFVPDVDGYSRRMAAMTAGSLAAEPRRDATTLSGLVRAEVTAYIDAFEAHLGDQDVVTPWYGAGATIPYRIAPSFMIGELLIHGLDVARGLGKPWAISAAEAVEVLPSSLFMAPRVVDGAAAGSTNAVFRIRFRGGPTVGVRFVDGSPETASWGEWHVSADCTLSADPVAFLLLSYGRKGQWPLIAQGKLLAYGRKPWFALKLAGMFVNP